MKLFLARHTKTVIPEEICYGQTDVLPASTFYSEFEELKPKLKDIKPDTVYSSPLIRCKILAIELGYSGIKYDNRLMEYNFGDWEMRLWNRITGEYIDRWMNDYVNTPAPGGESLIQMASRVESFLEDIKKAGYKKVLCFTHSGVIRIVNCLVNHVKLRDAFNLKVEFGNIYSFKLNDPYFLSVINNNPGKLY